MAQIKKVYPSWVNVYAGPHLYSNQNTLIAGGRIGEGALDSYETWFGVPVEVLNLLRTSKVPATLKLFVRAETNALEVWVYPHKALNNPGNTNPRPSGGRLNYFLVNKSPAELPAWVELDDDTLKVKDKLLSGEIAGFTLDGTVYDSFRMSNTGDNKPYFTVTGDWNTPPSKPTLTYPNGGESVSGVKNITWVPSTDAETPQNALTYQIQLSKNNGQTWSTIVAKTPVGVTSYAYDFSKETESNLAKVRIRAFDGTDYGDWSESGGVFAIQHNVAPLAPNNLSPSGGFIDRSIINKLSWRHNDSPGDIQSKAEVQWRLQGSSTWSTITIKGSAQETFVNADVFPVGAIEWQVRTYDQIGLVGPYSNVAVFTSASPTTAPVILQPTSPVNISRPVVEWTGAQQSYQIVIEDSLNAVVWDTGEVVSTVKARTVGVDLVNGATYKIKVRTKDTSGLFSSFSEKTVQVSYTPPEKPVVSISTLESGLSLIITNPTPTGTQPQTNGNDVYKRIDGEWIRIAKSIHTTYTDYALASEEQVEYRVRAIGENDTYRESDVIHAQAPKLRSVWIYDVYDPEMTIWQFKYDGDGRSDNYQREHAFRQFVGRKRPVVEYGTFTEYDVSANIKILKKDEDRERLRDFAESGNTLLYRDGRGRKLYTVLPILHMNELFFGNEVTLNLSEIDYDEEV